MSGATGDHPVIVRPVRMDDLDAFRARPQKWWIDLQARNGGEGSSVIFVADAGEQGLAGTTGLFTPPQPKLAHAGTIWGVYVRESFRRRRIGEQLLGACIDWARGNGLATVKLSVVSGNDAARHCYERIGFVTYGVEPLAVQWEGKLYDETLMAIRLK